MPEIIKVGNVELTKEDAWRLYEKQMYLVTYSRIYQLHYSEAQQKVYGSEIYYQPGLARRGRFHAMSAEAVNRLLKFDLVKTPAEVLADKIAAADRAREVRDQLKTAVALEYKGIVFDDWTIDSETGGIWGEMCEGCAEKHKDVLANELSDGGVGACSVRGCDVVGADCDNERHFYVDFQPELIRPLSREQLHTLDHEEVSLDQKLLAARAEQEPAQRATSAAPNLEQRGR